ncbi:MAG: two-component regulator propeller domain-containing protein, partial [Gemmatimonadota bacterium]
AFTQFHHDSADASSLSDESVYGVAEDAEGRLWVGTQRGLNRLDVDGRSFERHFHEPGRADSLAGDWVYALHRGPTGTLWVGTVGGGLGRWTGAAGRFENFSIASIAGGPRSLDDVFAVHETPDGRVWVGTRGGLAVFDPVARRAEPVDLTGAVQEPALVTSMNVDRSGRLWVGSLGHGAFAVDTATRQVERVPLEPAGKSAEPGSRQILSVATTEHMLLVGTWGQGVFRAPLERPPFRVLASGAGGNGLRHGNVTAVLASDEPGRPWVGSFGGGPQRVDVEAGTVDPSGGDAGDTIRASGVVSFAVTRDGTHFAGSTEGLFRYAADGRQLGLDAHVPGDDRSIGPGYVPALLPAAGNDLWVGIGGSGLFHRDSTTGRFEAFRHDPAVQTSLSGDYVTALLAAPDDRLWVGTRSHGLNRCRFAPFACERFDGREPGAPSLGHHFVTALRTDHGGNLWIATSGGGLRRAQFGEGGRVLGFDQWGTAEGLLSDSVMSLESDSDGSLWVATRRGLSHFDPASRRVVNYVPQSGLPVSHFNNGASAADEHYLYFGSVTGLVSVPKGLPLRLRPPSPVRITGVERLVDGSAMPLAPGEVEEPIEIGIDEVLAAEFAVLDFAETTHEYAYRLQGSDEWTPLAHRRQLTFVGLPPGNYSLEVRGRDAFGHWSASPPLDFEVVPPFWMTNWFRGLALVIIALLALGIHLARLRSLRERNAMLGQLTERLESAKEEERSRISRELHDELGQTLTAAKLNLQMARAAVADAGAAGRVDDSIGMMDGMIRQTRDIARGLRPPLLDEAGLVPAIDDFLRSAATRSGIHIDFEVAPGVSRAPPGLNTTVFRLVQEAVGNALRHASARVVRVMLRDEDDALWLVVEDDGVGFDPAVVSRSARGGAHLGLLGMTERARSAGGTIEFESRPGAGSRIIARIPFERPRPPISGVPR